MTETETPFVQFIYDHLQEEWGMGDADLQHKLAGRVLKNMEALSRKITRTAEAKNWDEVTKLATRLRALADHLQHPAIVEIAQETEEATQSKDSLYVISTMEQLHRLVIKEREQWK